MTKLVKSVKVTLIPNFTETRVPKTYLTLNILY